MRRLSVFVLVAVFAVFPGFTGANDDLSPSFDEVISLLKMDPSVKQRALAGKIVMLDRKNSIDKELALALVAVIRRPYNEVLNAVKGNRLFQFNEYILDFVEIKGSPDESKFQGLGFTTSDTDEGWALLEAKAGNRSNLSTEEIARFRKLRAEVAGLDDAAFIDAVNKVIHTSLAERLRRYQAMGLNGITTYQRSGEETSSPAEELVTATRAMEDMKRYAPEFFNILQNFPDAQLTDVEHRFYVFKADIEGRTGFILSHRIYFFGTEFTILAERHIYTPHSYNSLQLVAGIIPHEDSSVLFYGNRTYTDQVSGLGSSIKHSVGSEMMAEEIKALISDVRDGLESGKTK